jgi:hypothetical protein
MSFFGKVLRKDVFSLQWMVMPTSEALSKDIEAGWIYGAP